MSNATYVAGRRFAIRAISSASTRCSRSWSFSKLGRPSHMITTSPSRMARFAFATIRRSGYRCVVSYSLRFWSLNFPSA